jgi:hypothetical protein
MPLSGTWYTTANRAFDLNTLAFNVAQSTIFALKAYLMGDISGTDGPEGARPSSAYWTIESSSDGVTASAADNLGGGTFNATKWLRAGAGVAHSWFVLKSPASPGITDGPWYLMASLGTASDTNWVLAISKNAFAGGTITADPTSSNQSTYTTTQFDEAVNTAGKTHFITNAAGNFWFLVSKNGSGICRMMVSFQTLADARSSGDSARSILMFDYSAASRGTPRFPESSTPTWRGLNYDGTTAITGTTGKLVQINAAATTLGSAFTTSNGNDSKIDFLPGCYVFDTTAAKTGCRGRIPDCWMVGAQAAVGAVEPSAASPARVIIGYTAIPMSVVPSL